MFELLFKYPPAAFAKGSFVLLGGLPSWVLIAAIAGTTAAIGWFIWRRRRGWGPGTLGLRPVPIWLLESALAALILLLLWRPAISVPALKPQQNVVVILLDDSRSMAILENGKTRVERASAVLNAGLLEDLRRKFQVRLYRFGGGVKRIDNASRLTGGLETTRINDVLRQIVSEATSFPIGAVVLISDGADNSGGIDLPTITDIRRHKIPVHTIGVGRDRMPTDVELTAAVLPSRTLPDSRLSAQITFRQSGFKGRKARIVVSESGRTLASHEITLGSGDTPQTESVAFNTGVAGVKSLSISVGPLEGEENIRNNALTRLVNVEARKPRVLYFEGEPRWDLKFIRRAIEDDRCLRLTSIVRTTQNKNYVQGADSPKGLEDGFPSDAEVLLSYHALILGSAEAGYFTPVQQELIRQFVDRRGGGVLFLGGRAALSDGAYSTSGLADLLPVVLPDHGGTFRRERARADLTAAGRESLICRFDDDPARNAERWKKLPALADYQDAGAPKPAALTLADYMAGGRRYPLLVTQNYGRGRTAVFATGGSWRWQMLQDVSDKTHEMFWQQLLRWLVADSTGPVVIFTPHQVLSDETRLQLRVKARDGTFSPAADAKVEARILGPGGVSDDVELTPDSSELGTYAAAWVARAPGSYLVEASARQGDKEIGRDMLTFLREDGVAENFRTEQNRELLERLASQTGGRYYTVRGAGRLSREISYSEAGITTRELQELWNMPAVFFLLLLLRATDWFLRRKWSLV